MFQYLHSIVLAILLEPENKLCEERGYDQADVFIMSEEEGKVYARGQIFNAELRNLKEIQQFTGKCNHAGLYLARLALWCVLIKKVLGEIKGRSFSTCFDGSWHTSEAEEVTNFFRKT